VEKLLRTTDKAFNALKHGLEFDPSRVWGDARKQPWKNLRRVVRALLQPFPSPPPPAAQVLAQRIAFKVVRAASFEAYVLAEGKPPAAAADSLYLSLTGSIRADLMALSTMAKDGQPSDRPPSLDEYLAAFKSGSIVPVEGEAQGEGSD
jgi:hypothetical protein